MSLSRHTCNTSGTKREIGSEEKKGRRERGREGSGEGAEGDTNERRRRGRRHISLSLSSLLFFSDRRREKNELALFLRGALSRPFLSLESFAVDGRGERVSTPARTPEKSTCSSAFVLLFLVATAIDWVPSLSFFLFSPTALQRMGRASLQVLLSGLPPAQKRLLAVS